MSDPKFQVRAERAEDMPSLNALAARAFGPGRFTRSAYRIREAAGPVDELSLTAWAQGGLAGSIRFTAIRIGTRSGALLLGPLMVGGEWAGKGCGRALIAKGLELAGKQGFALVILVGDLPYYRRFGFKRVPHGQITMPGPVDPDRLLAAELMPDALAAFSGPVTGESRSP